MDANVAAAVSIADGVASLDRLSAVLGDLQLVSQARIGLTVRHISAKADLDAPDLSSSLAAIGMGQIRGACHLEADISGCYDNISKEWLFDNIPMDKIVLKKWLDPDMWKTG